MNAGTHPHLNRAYWMGMAKAAMDMGANSMEKIARVIHAVTPIILADGDMQKAAQLEADPSLAGQPSPEQIMALLQALGIQAPEGMGLGGAAGAEGLPPELAAGGLPPEMAGGAGAEGLPPEMMGGGAEGLPPEMMGGEAGAEGLPPEMMGGGEAPPPGPTPPSAEEVAGMSAEPPAEGPPPEGPPAEGPPAEGAPPKKRESGEKKEEKKDDKKEE